MMGGPKIKELDDLTAQEMHRYRFKDGRIASIWEKWIEQSPRYVAYWNKWDPGAMTRQHGHRGDHINFIIQGEIRCGDLVAKAGSHILLEWGDLFGPWVAGPEGCELYGFMAGDGTPFPGDESLFQALLKKVGAEEIPLPMPDHLPPWSDLSWTKGSVTAWTDEG
jgi:hypothetical protein